MAINIWPSSVARTNISTIAKQAKDIFQPYVTNKQKGTGLGLAIVKKVIEEHGGTIVLDNQYKSGAGFIMQFPVIFEA